MPIWTDFLGHKKRMGFLIFVFTIRHLPRRQRWQKWIWWVGWIYAPLVPIIKLLWPRLSEKIPFSLVGSSETLLFQTPPASSLCGFLLIAFYLMQSPYKTPRIVLARYIPLRSHYWKFKKYIVLTAKRALHVIASNVHALSQKSNRIFWLELLKLLN